MPATASVSPDHPMTMHITPRKAPFFSTAVFVPRFKLVLTNNGAALEGAQISAQVAEWDLPIGQIHTGTFPVEWQDTGASFSVTDWKPGEKRTFDVKPAPSVFPRPGTYALRVQVSRGKTKITTAREMWTKSLEDLDLDPAKRDAALKHLLARDPAPEDPRPIQFWDQVLEGHVLDYIRVEPFSSVLNFGVVVGTFVVALATLALALGD